MRSDFPLSVLAALTQLNTGGSVIISGRSKAALVSPAARADAELIRLHETTANSPVTVAMGAEEFDALGMNVVPGGPFPIGESVDVDRDAFVAMSRDGRARTARALAGGRENGNRVAFRTPGHVVPVRSTEGSLLSRVGMVEAAADLMRLAGQRPASLFSFLLDDGGAVTTEGEGALPDGLAGFPVVSIEDVRTARLLRAEGQPGDSVASLFVDAMIRVPSGVSVITAADQSAQPVGLVVSSLTSYSNDPPSVVVSIGHASRSHGPITTAEYFGVNVLANTQAEHARIFSSRSSDRFGAVEWSWSPDVPELAGAQTFLRCRRVAQYSFGDHTLVIGAIVSGESRAVPPLIYVNRAFDHQLK